MLVLMGNQIDCVLSLRPVAILLACSYALARCGCVCREWKTATEPFWQQQCLLEFGSSVQRSAGSGTSSHRLAFAQYAVCMIFKHWMRVVKFEPDSRLLCIKLLTVVHADQKHDLAGW